MASAVHTGTGPHRSQMSFTRSGSEMTSFDSRPSSFTSAQPQHNSQQYSYGNMSPPAHQSSIAYQPNGYRSFGEPNGERTPQPSSNSQIYTAVYSGVQVYEMEVHNVAVMRRRSDSWLNATQILKVAGVEKGKRTKIIEKEILTGQYEKVQGGYGKYQGTWINYNRGREFCRQYGVEHLLRPLLEYDVGSDGSGQAGQLDTPTKEQAMAANRKRFFNSSIDSRVNGQGPGGTFFQNISPTASNALAAMNKAARFESPMPRPGSVQRHPSGSMRRSSQQNASQESGFLGSQPSFTSDHGVDGSGPDSTYGTMSGQSYGKQLDSRIQDGQEPPRKKIRPSSSHDQHMSFDPNLQEETPTEPNESFVYNNYNRDTDQGPSALPPLVAPNDSTGDNKRLALLDLFADPARVDYSNHTAIIHFSGQDLDIPLDASANTALHWAATLARVSLMRLLVSKGANMFRGNAAGQTPLMAAVQVNNSLDHGCFPEMLETLGSLIELRDATGRTVLHHIAVSSGIKGRSQSSRYYLESLLEFLVRKGGNSASNSQQNSFDNGNTKTADALKHKAIGLGKFISEVVNVQDKSGNTALNLVARIGNRAIINQLDEIGADHTIPNNTGFRPTDFGVLPRAQQSSTQQSSSQDANSSSQTKQHSQIDQIKDEIFATTTSILTQTTSHYTTELTARQSHIDAQAALLRDAAAQHKAELERLQSLQQSAKSRTDRSQKIANLKAALVELKARIEAGNKNSKASSPKRHDVKMIDLKQFDEALLAPPSPSSPAPELSESQKSQLAALPSVPTIRAHLAASTGVNAGLADQLSSLRSRSSELEEKYRRVVALCTGVPEEKVEQEGMLEGLVEAVESEVRLAEGTKGGNPGHVDQVMEESLDVGRVREFLRKVEGVGG